MLFTCNCTSPPRLGKAFHDLDGLYCAWCKSAARPVEPAMKAYVVENGSEDGEYLGIGYTECEPHEDWDSPKRAEWADQHAPNDPPAKAWMEAGYSFSCSYCEHQLSLSEGYCDRCAGEMDDDDLNAENVGIVFDGDVVYCGAGCQAADRAEIEARRVAKELCKAAFLERFPFATVTHVWTGGACKCECFNKDYNNASLHFTVPGGKVGDYGNSFCGGCKKAWVCHGDLEAFRLARAARLDKCPSCLRPMTAGLGVHLGSRCKGKQKTSRSETCEY